ncbi:MAG TPA: hypothetical protein VND19_17275 [Acetobacteraceae bacterium]|nr:hypothetical protein [Acetobacteraceae bacterium]
MLPQVRPDVTGPNRALTLQHEQYVLANLTGGGANEQNLAAPTAGVTHKLRLISNLFPVHAKGAPNLESYANQTDFNVYRDLWGDGTRVPIVVQALIMRSDGTSTAGVPEALGQARVVWDWREPDPNRWRDPLAAGATQHTDSYLDAAHHPTGPPPQPANVQNAPVGLGGKQDGAPLQVFPPAQAVPPFPYTVAACPNRPWAVWSEFWRAGNPVGPAGTIDRSGVVFQPARQAGDGYLVTAWLDVYREADAADAIAATAPHSSDYRFLVQRRVNTYYLTRGGAADTGENTPALVAHLKTVYERELFTVMDVIEAPVNNATYTNALNGTLQPHRPYTNGAALENLGLVPALPFLMRHLIDHAPAANSPGIPFRTWAQFTNGLDAEFQNGVIRMFNGVGNAATLRGQRFTGNVSGSTGVVLNPDGAAPYFVLCTPPGLNDQEVVTCDWSGGNVTLGTRQAPLSCTTRQPDVVNPGAGAAYESTIDVSIDGRAAVHVTFPRTFGPASNFRTDLSGAARTVLRNEMIAAAAAHNEAQPLTITITARQTTPRSLQRLANVQTLLNTLINSERRILVRDAILNEMRGAAATPLQLPCLSNFGNAHQSALMLELLGDTIKSYADTTYAGQSALFMMHLPGRFNGIVAPGQNVAMNQPRVAGAFYPEATQLRNRGIGFVASVPLAQALNLPTRNADSIVCHEIGHALFLPHEASQSQPRVAVPSPHPECHVAGDSCIMNYDLDSDHFCGLCMLRVRGWNWNAPAVVNKLIAVEIRDGNAGGQVNWTGGPVRQYTNIVAKQPQWIDAGRLDGTPVRIANIDRLTKEIRVRLVFSNGANADYSVELVADTANNAVYSAQERAHAAFNFPTGAAQHPAGNFTRRQGYTETGTAVAGVGEISLQIRSPAVGDTYRVVGWDNGGNHRQTGDITTWRAVYYMVLRGGAPNSVPLPGLRGAVEPEMQAQFTDAIFLGEEPAPALRLCEYELPGDAVATVRGFYATNCRNLPGQTYGAYDPWRETFGLVDQLAQFRLIPTTAVNCQVGHGAVPPTVRVEVRQQPDQPGYDLRKGLWEGFGPWPRPDDNLPGPPHEWLQTASITVAGIAIPIPPANLVAIETSPALKPGCFNEIDVRVADAAFGAVPAAGTIQLRVAVFQRYVNGMARINAIGLDSRGIVLIPARREFEAIAVGAQLNSAIHEFGHSLRMVAAQAEANLDPHDNFYAHNGNHCRWNLPITVANDGPSYQIPANTDIAQCVMFGFVSDNNPRTQFCARCRAVMRKIDMSPGVM